MRDSSTASDKVRYPRLVTALVFMLILTFGWSAVAFAATPADIETENPTAPVSSFVGTSSDVQGVSAESAESADPSLNVLPDTGGSMLLLSALGGVALIGCGVRLLRRT